MLASLSSLCLIPANLSFFNIHVQEGDILNLFVKPGDKG